MKKLLQLLLITSLLSALLATSAYAGRGDLPEPHVISEATQYLF